MRAFARTGRWPEVRAALRRPEAPRVRAERAGLAAAAANLRRDAVRPRHRPAGVHASAAADHAGASALAATRSGPPLPPRAPPPTVDGAPVAQVEFGTTILFLSVDATSVQLMSHDAAFMYVGLAHALLSPPPCSRVVSGCPAQHAHAWTHTPRRTGRHRRKGRLIELRASHELFDEPRERETRSYLTLSRGNEDRSRGKNLRNAFQTGESVFQL